MLFFILSQIYKIADERQVYNDDELQVVAYSQDDIRKIFSVIDKINITNDIKRKKTDFGNIHLEYSNFIKVYYKGKFTGCAFENKDDFNAVYYSYNNAEILVIDNAVFLFNGNQLAVIIFLNIRAESQ